MQERAIQLPLDFDPVRLQRDLETTIAYGTVRQFGHYHDGSWTGLSLRAEGGRALTTNTGLIPSGEPFADSPVLKDTPYFREVLGRIPPPHRAVRLLHLPPGARIEPHVDSPLTFQHGILRLHIPIVTHPEVEFCIDGLRCNWRAGELWWGNFSLLHHVYNRSSINRVHMVLDVEITPALLSLFPPRFVAEQVSEGISFHSSSICLAHRELRQLECELRIPPNVLPHAELRSGGIACLRATDQHLTLTSLAPSSTSAVLQLVPIARDEFAIVGWSHAVTMKLTVADGQVAGATLVVRGLPRRPLEPESPDNPRLARNPIAFELVNASATRTLEPA